MSGAGKKPVAVQLKNWWAQARVNPWFRGGLTGAAIIAGLDQLSKFWIVHIVDLPARGKIELSGIFDLTYVQNFGASFGILSGGLASRIILSAVSFGVAVGLAGWLGQVRRPVAAIGLAFIIGGALGNLYDRLAYGYVIDFFDFSGLHFPWVFNIADSAINVGVAFLILDAWQTREKPQTGAKMQ